MKPTAVARFEASIMARIAADIGQRPSAVDVEQHLLRLIHRHERAYAPDRRLAHLLRLAIMACPDSPRIDSRLGAHRRALADWTARALPDLIATIAICNSQRLPVPVIFSCRKYLNTARRFRDGLRARYFGLMPVIVSGDAKALEERIAGGVLHLPVDDSYEGLSGKVFETILLLSAMGADHGIIKFDDDLHFTAEGAPDADRLRAILATGDYIGSLVGADPALAAIVFDRAWHYGKCSTPVPPLYGKPFRGRYVSGGLYYLSGRAMTALSRHYRRYPACLAGELYEDKAVGDMLRELDIGAMHHPLGPELHVSFAEGADRLVRPVARKADPTPDHDLPAYPMTPWHRCRAALSAARLSDRTRLLLPAIRPLREPEPSYLPKDVGGAFTTLWNEQSYGRARHLLARVMRVAVATETSLYLFWGTLLGRVREGRMLPWDDDIDLALFDPGKLEALQFALLREGLRIHEHGDGKGGEFWIKVFDPAYPVTSDQGWSYPFLDIFVYMFDGGETGEEWPVRRFSRADIEPGRQVVFEGTLCLEPQWPMALLDSHYPGWRRMEKSPVWDHFNERPLDVSKERPIRIGWRGAKRRG